MRRVVLLFVLLIDAGTLEASAQEALAPGAFGALGMYPKRLTCADVPTFSEPSAPLRLLSAQDGNGTLRRAFAPPDTLVIPGGMGVGLQVGQRFFVRRLLPSPTHVKPTAAHPGVVHTAGWITITASDTYAAVARIDHACDALLAGDFLEPYAPTPMPMAIAARGADSFEGMGQLLFGSDGRRSFANGDLIAINRGANHGVVAGARLSVYRDVKSAGPLVPVGQAIVLTVGADTATVIADQVRDALSSGDWIALQVPATRR